MGGFLNEKGSIYLEFIVCIAIIFLICGSTYPQCKEYCKKAYYDNVKKYENVDTKTTIK